MITPLQNPDFLPAFVKVIDSAKSSIVVVNFLAMMGDGRQRNPVLEIAEALAKAKKRGVAVSVFLEGVKFGDNYPFYRYLKDRGVDVWLDTSETYIHEKMIMVDEKIVISGSHNLTAGSFFRSEEFSLLTEDEDVVQAFGRALLRITKQRDDIRGKIEKDFISLPLGLVRQVIAPLYKAHAELAFNLYFMMCLEDGGKCGPLPVDAKKRIAALGLDPKSAGKGVSEKYMRYYHVHRMNRLIGQLKKMGIVEVDRDADTISRIELDKNFGKPWPDKKSSDKNGMINIPRSFLQDGWLLRLSFPAKYFYIISLVESVDSPFYPWWSLSIRNLVKKYGCDQGIGKGALELEKAKVLEILRATPVKRGESYSEEAQYYRLNPI